MLEIQPEKNSSTRLLSLILGSIVIALFSLSGCKHTSPDEPIVPDPGPDTLHLDTSTSSFARPLYDVAFVRQFNVSDHEAVGDYDYNEAEATRIELNGNSISVTGAGTTVNGSKVTITAAGTYIVSGSLDDGQVVVKTNDDEVVKIVFDGVTISNSTTAPVFISKAEKTIIFLADNSANTIVDPVNYVFEGDDDEPNAALFAKGNLTLTGTGSLTVNAHFNDGISSKDGLLVKSGTYHIAAKDDGIRGKDYLVIYDGAYFIEAEGDGLKSDDEGDSTKGFVLVKGGAFVIEAGGDGVQAESDLLIEGGSFQVTAGGGSGASISEDASAKGLKAGKFLVINNGAFEINVAEDGIHADGEIVINDGEYTISAADDAIHGEFLVGIAGGRIDIVQSYEGIESGLIVINAGTIHVLASDDGVNAAGQIDRSDPTFQDRGIQNNFLSINGGYLYVDALGDGLDVNGYAEMTGGVVLIDGPIANDNGPVDFDFSFRITGGFLLAVGSRDMAQIPGPTSQQNSVLLTFPFALPSETLFRIQDVNGTPLVTFQPKREYESIAFSSPDLKIGSSYEVFTGGIYSVPSKDGLCEGGDYSGGTKRSGFVQENVSEQPRIH